MKHYITYSLLFLNFVVLNISFSCLLFFSFVVLTSFLARFLEFKFRFENAENLKNGTTLESVLKKQYSLTFKFRYLFVLLNLANGTYRKTNDLAIHREINCKEWKHKEYLVKLPGSTIWTRNLISFVFT